MKKQFLTLFILLLIFSKQLTAQKNFTANFDDDWRFHLGAAQGAEQAGFDDAAWRKIDLPHDWSIEDLKGTKSPFNPDAISQVSGGLQQAARRGTEKYLLFYPRIKLKRYIFSLMGFT